MLRHPNIVTLLVRRLIMLLCGLVDKPCVLLLGSGVAWVHPLCWRSPRHHSGKPCFYDEIWLLGKNKFIRLAASPLHSLAVGGAHPKHRR